MTTTSARVVGSKQGGSGVTRFTGITKICPTWIIVSEKICVGVFVGTRVFVIDTVGTEELRNESIKGGNPKMAAMIRAKPPKIIATNFGLTSIFLGGGVNCLRVFF